MKNIKLLLLILICSLSLSFQVNALDINAKYAILMDYDSGEILYSKNSEIRTAPSSMTKLLTSYMVFELLQNGNVQLTDKFYISKKAWRMGGARTFLEYGSYVPLETLILGMIVQSGNDATVAIAEGVAGSEEEFVKLMNDKAKELGLNNSKLFNCTGWPREGHVMSTRDLAELSRLILKKFPQYSHYFAMKEFTYNNIRQENRNSLLKRAIGVDGLKTGLTESAGYGLAATAMRGDRRVITVVNGLSSDKLRDQNTMQLINFGFNSFTNIKVAKKDEVLAEIPIWSGKDKYISVKSPSDLYFTVNNARANKAKVILHHDSQIRAPIKKGAKIASLEIQGLGEEVTIPILAESDYKASLLNPIFSLFY